MTKEEARNIQDVTVKDARLYFHNFDGKSQFSNSGDIEFGVIIPKELADELANEGWNVRVKEYSDSDRDPVHYIKAKINFTPRRKKDNSIIEEFVPEVYVYVDGSDCMTKITSKEEMAMYEGSPESNTRVDILGVTVRMAPRYAELPQPHITAYVRHMVMTVRIMEKESNANIVFPEFVGIKGYKQ